MGRPETLEDACAVSSAWQAQLNNNGRLDHLLKALLTSDVFRYRRNLAEAEGEQP